LVLASLGLEMQGPGLRLVTEFWF